MKKKFLGRVITVKDGDKGYIITFDILGLDEFLVKPSAIPIGNIAQEIKVGDLVIIEDISGENELPYFIYQPIIEGAFIGVKNGNNSIDLTNKEEVTINLPGINITYKDSKIDINISSSDVSVKLNNCSLSGNFKGTASYTGEVGPFCILPNCLFTGAQHSGSKVTP